MFTFLAAMDADNTDMARAIETLDLPPNLQASGSQFATQLLGVVNRIGLITESQLPDAARAADIQSFRFFPQDTIADHRLAVRNGADGSIVLTRGDDGGWRFSRATIDGLDTLYDSVFSLAIRAGIDEAQLDSSFSMRVRRWMPAPLRERFLFVAWYQWIGLLLLIFLAVVVDTIVQMVLRGAATRRIRSRGGDPKPDAIKKTVRPYGLLAGAIFVIAMINFLGLPAPALAVVIPAIRLILTVAGVWAAFRTTDLAADLFAQKAAQSDNKFDDLLVPLLRKTIKIFVTAIGLIYIANALNIDIVPLLTGLGIGGLAVAFAAKDTIENFFGSVSVILDQPFEVGDWVQIGDVEGTVEELGFRSTRIRTFYNSLITVPNASLVRANVDNFGRRKYRRTRTSLGLEYGTPPEKIEAFCEGIRELIRSHPYTRKDYFVVYFNNFGPHSLDILVYCFHECPDWQTELRERQRLYTDIIRLADRLGVGFAFPTQTLFVNPENSDQEPAPTPGRTVDIESKRMGLEAVHAITKDAVWREAKPAPETLGPPDLDTDDQIESKVGGEG
jgi:MscS family membrane protein